MTLARRALPDVLAACLVAAALYAFFGHAFLNYDSFYALVWGDDLAHGRAPEYEVPVAPTPHPQLVAVGALLSPLGDAAEDVVLALVLLGFGAICAGLYRLGQELYAWPVGLLAAAIFATRVPPLNFGIRGYVDLPTIALIVWAAVLEARRPRRGTPVLVLLAVAGLLRPEAWLFAGAYWLWLGRPLRLLPLAAAAPVVWGLSDLLVTGDPLWSLNGTSDLAAQLGRRTGLDDVASVMPRRLGEIMRLPELVAAVGGLCAGLMWLRRRTLLPAAVAVLNGLAFLVFAVAGLPLLGRYLFLAAAMLSLLAALACVGWLAVEPPVRERWRVAGLGALAVVIVVFALQQVDRLADLRDDIAARDEVQADLRDLVRSEGPLDRCGDVFVPNHRPVPAIAYWADRRPSEIHSAARVRPSRDGVFIAPRPEVEQLSILDPRDPTRPATAVPAGYSLVTANRSWRLYAGPDCAA
jgi:hypothetical protein